MQIINEELGCPFCKKGKVAVTIIPEYYSYKTARAIHQIKRIPVYHPEKIEVNSPKCPACGKSRREIKESLTSGNEKIGSNEERLKRMRDAGLPTKIEKKC